MNRTKKNDLGRKYAESETKKEGFPFRLVCSLLGRQLKK